MNRWILWTLPCLAVHVGCAAEPTCEELQNCPVASLDSGFDEKPAIDRATPIEASLGSGEGDGAGDVSPEFVPGDASSSDILVDASNDSTLAPADGDGNAAANLDASSIGPDGAVGIGHACIASTECASRNCVEKVCCNMDCTGKCMSCLAANTGKTNGTCTAIPAGTDPRNECAPDDPTHCGNDGMCDGAGACRKYDSTTVCQTESCVNNGRTSTTHTSASKCDGRGTCVATQSADNCGNFLCATSGDQCAASCQASTGCTSASYCAANHVCSPTKPLGAQCASTEECMSGVCGGRCCSSACICPQPSAGNLIRNAGFDSDLAGWATFGTQWSNMDADECPYSGSANVLSGAGNPSACFTVTPGVTYSIGGWFRNTDGNIYACTWSQFTTADCSNGAVDGVGMNGSETNWTFHGQLLTTGPSVIGVRFGCEANPNTFIDKLFLTPYPGGY